jgi:adenosine deaminase CECR1
MFGADGHENIPHRDWIIAFERVMNEVKAQLAREGRPDAFFGARVRARIPLQPSTAHLN